MNEYIFVPLVFPIELNNGDKLDSILKTFKAPSDKEALEILKKQPGSVFRKIHPVDILESEDFNFKKMI